eukprot:TRINITY_DN12013_c0_g1_i2.p1 TRINITY_DN12013_c0_g1~~TRINITY_DN12013_c0_g1_i2.p1  ORF type:complete len:429 (+),score=18.56 TRINITY_DN12013_c0_g1_i2:121-1407(+)
MGAAPSHPAPAQQRRSPTAAPPHYHPPAPYVHPPYAPAPYPYGYTYPPPPHGSGVAPSPWAGQPHPNPWYGGYPGHAPPPYQMPMMPMNGPPPAIVAEPQQAVTIRNEVNVKRSSLHLQRDPTDPKKLLVAFTFDATVAGSLSIFLAAREGDDCSFTELFPHVHKARVFTFKKGLGQQFVEPAGSGWDVSAFPEEQLFNFSPADSVFPLVIRTRVEPKSVPDKSSGPLGSAATSSTSHAGQSSAGAEPSGSSDLVGGPLPRSAQSQMTYAVFERVAPGKITEKTASLDLGRAVPSNDGPFGESSEHPQPRFALRAFKQKIWVDGTKYEVQEIYGIEQFQAMMGLLERAVNILNLVLRFVHSNKRYGWMAPSMKSRRFTVLSSVVELVLRLLPRREDKAQVMARVLRQQVMETWVQTKRMMMRWMGKTV